MQITNINNSTNNNINNISYKSLKVPYSDTWHPELLKEILHNKEIKKAADFIEKRNSNMEMYLVKHDEPDSKTYSVHCTYDRRYKPQGEECQILHNMTLEEALKKLKNFNARNFIAFVKKTERTNVDKLRQMRLFGFNNGYENTQKTDDKSVMHKLLKFFGL